MFKKGPDIDKKKLLNKAIDVNRESSSRLKNFKTLIEHSDYNELMILFKTHYKFIYHTFLNTFDNFDGNSKHRKENIDCLLFILEKILIYQPELIRKRWQFMSITSIMRKLLNQSNIHNLRQEGIRLFLLWYMIISEENDDDLDLMFASIVPDLTKNYDPSDQIQRQNIQSHQHPLQRSLTSSNSSTTTNPSNQSQVYQNQMQLSKSSSIIHLQPPDIRGQYIIQQSSYNQDQISQQSRQQPESVQLSSKPIATEPLIARGPNDQLNCDETKYFLDCLLQNMVTLIAKPIWTSPEHTSKHQDLSFAFLFNQFKKIYLQSIFPNLDQNLSPSSIKSSCLTSNLIKQYADDISPDCDISTGRSTSISRRAENPTKLQTYQSKTKDTIRTDNVSKMVSYKQSQQYLKQSLTVPIHSDLEAEYEDNAKLSEYQAIVIKWLTRILRQDFIPGQDELVKGSMNESLNNSQLTNKENANPQSHLHADSSNLALFPDIDSASSEIEVARRVIGTCPENINIIHEVFKSAFLNYRQPASMKRVVNVYKEWICNGKAPTCQPVSGSQHNGRLGFTSFSDLLQIFVVNTSHAFTAQVASPQMLEEQVEMCKRIMNLYRYMVMKIYMSPTTWEQLLEVMLKITQQLFSITPPESRDTCIGGRIAPAFFQTIIVSWIRANLYVHISDKMWAQFYQIMKTLVQWRELIEEWGSTMNSLTRVLVKHVYGLNLTDLPLDKPQDRRRRPRAMQSFSNAEAIPRTIDQNSSKNPSDKVPKYHDLSKRASCHPTTNSTVYSPGASQRMSVLSMQEMHARMARSNSEGYILTKNNRMYFASLKPHYKALNQMRKIKSEYQLSETNFDATTGLNSGLPSHNDAIDSPNLKETNNMIIDQAIEDNTSSSSKQSSLETSKQPPGAINKGKNSKSPSVNKCVMLGGSIRGWTPENSVIMWRRMLGLLGNINDIDNPDNHLVAIRCIAIILCDFIKTRENLGVSLDNQSSPDLPSLVPPLTYVAAWLLEATHLPDKFRESKVTACKLLCLLTIRRHDIKPSTQYHTAFYEAIYRGLMSPDSNLHKAIIKNCSRLLTLEMPGGTFLAHCLFERCKSFMSQITNNEQSSSERNSIPLDQAIEILNSILALNRPIRKLMVLKTDLQNHNHINLVAAGEIRAKVFDIFSSRVCSNFRPSHHSQSARLNNKQTDFGESLIKMKCIFSMAMHVYQVLNDQQEYQEIDKLFDILCDSLREASSGLECGELLEDSFLRNISDTIRLFAEQASRLCKIKPQLVTNLMQHLCHSIAHLGSAIEPVSARREKFACLLICLEDWCMSVGKDFLLRPIHDGLNSNFTAADIEDDTFSNDQHSESLLSVIMRSLDSVINSGMSLSDDSAANLRTSSSRLSSNSDQSPSKAPGQLSPHDVFPMSRERTNPTDTHSIDPNFPKREQRVRLSDDKDQSIKTSCKVSRQKLVTFLGQYPLRQLGPSSMSCCLNEFHLLNPSNNNNNIGNINNDLPDANSDIWNSNDLNILVFDDNTIISFIASQSNDRNYTSSISRLIIRNPCGKYSWMVTQIDSNTLQSKSQQPFNNIESNSLDSLESIVVDPETFKQIDQRSQLGYDTNDLSEDGISNSSVSSKASSNRDQLCDILNHVAMGATGGPNSSLSSNQMNSHKKRNAALSQANSKYQIAQAEETMIALLYNQNFQEINYCDRASSQDRIVIKVGGRKPRTFSNKSFGEIKDEEKTNNPCSFDKCRQLIQQLGFLNWEKRTKVDSLKKSARLIRELKNLDAQLSRETHKIAVIYVANGQEDKQSILCNTNASQAFENFVSGLGWDVNLATHSGFKGGLQSNKSTGDTSLYYCNSTTEVMFHVSTRISITGPTDDESLNKKLRHLGNDEIHIVWSEHIRDYRRGIIPTEFGDVIIVLYPMVTFQGYCRIHILAKPEVPNFGPLYDNCVVHESVLAPLVRATAINASRAKRLNMPLYLSSYEERIRLIETIVKNHKDKQSFEDFAAQLF